MEHGAWSLSNLCQGSLAYPVAHGLGCPCRINCVLNFILCKEITGLVLKGQRDDKSYGGHIPPKYQYWLNHLVSTFVHLIPAELYFYFSSSLFIVTFVSISAGILIPAWTMKGSLAAVPSLFLVL